jgi:hypothetical protein
MKNSIFWGITRCSLLMVNRHISPKLQLLSTYYTALYLRITLQSWTWRTVSPSRLLHAPIRDKFGLNLWRETGYDKLDISWFFSVYLDKCRAITLSSNVIYSRNWESLYSKAHRCIQFLILHAGNETLDFSMHRSTVRTFPCLILICNLHS